MNAVMPAAANNMPKLSIRIPPPRPDAEILKTPRSPVAPRPCPTFVMNWFLKKYVRVKA